MSRWPQNYRTLTCTAVLLISAGTVMTAQAAQTTVYGEVIDVERLQSGPDVQCAHVPKPATSAGLTALLNWDLQDRPEAAADCRARLDQRVQEYRVTYRYDGREFIDVLPHDPGSRIALTLELE
ncbi:MAG: hypothetical protein AB8B93_15455 [Pseudomonadales bacterium]